MKNRTAFFSTVAGRGHRVCVAASVRCVGVWHRFRRSSNGDRNRKRGGRSGASDGKERKPRGLTKKKKSLSPQRALICLSETCRELVKQKCPRWLFFSHFSRIAGNLSDGTDTWLPAPNDWLFRTTNVSLRMVSLLTNSVWFEQIWVVLQCCWLFAV